MTVAAILKHKGTTVFSVAPTATIAEVAHVLSQHDIGAVLVQDAVDQVVGIVSERDIVRSLSVNNGRNTLEMTAGLLMTRVRHTVTPTTRAEEAMEIMTKGRIRHLPVIENDRLVGIISIGDVVKVHIVQQAHEVASLRSYVAGQV